MFFRGSHTWVLCIVSNAYSFALVPIYAFASALYKDAGIPAGTFTGPISIAFAYGVDRAGGSAGPTTRDSPMGSALTFSFTNGSTALGFAPIFANDASALGGYTTSDEFGTVQRSSWIFDLHRSRDSKGYWAR